MRFLFDLKFVRGLLNYAFRFYCDNNVITLVRDKLLILFYDGGDVITAKKCKKLN